jgi:hypothetical protein
MSCVLYVDDKESNKKINIDELYDKKKQRDLKQLTIFNKILNRIHKRIMHTGKTKMQDKHIWFTIPEYIFGEPVYDKGDCTGYLVAKLEENGFHIRYIHPNTLFVSWQNWVPSYVRTEVKKKTGMIIDEKGNIVDKVGEEGDANVKLFQDKQTKSVATGGGKQYTPIDQYKPTGNLVYNPELFEKLEKKMEWKQGNA